MTQKINIADEALMRRMYDEVDNPILSRLYNASCDMKRVMGQIKSNAERLQRKMTDALARLEQDGANASLSWEQPGPTALELEKQIQEFEDIKKNILVLQHLLKLSDEKAAGISEATFARLIKNGITAARVKS